MHLNLEVNSLVTCNNIDIMLLTLWLRDTCGFTKCGENMKMNMKPGLLQGGYTWQPNFFCKQTTPPQTSRKCEMQTNYINNTLKDTDCDESCKMISLNFANQMGFMSAPLSAKNQSDPLSGCIASASRYRLSHTSETKWSLNGSLLEAGTY